MSGDLAKLDEIVSLAKTSSGTCIHTAPLIRRENEYALELREVRRKLLFFIFMFI